MKSGQHGITLIELIISIVVIGILVAIATTRVNTSSITLSQQAEAFAADIRHTQSLAIHWGCQLTIAATTAPAEYQVLSKSSYAGKICSAAATVIKDPRNGNDFTATLVNGIVFSANQTLYFDSFGRPIDIVGSIISADTVFTLTKSGVSYEIRVVPLSGYVTVVKL
ncbi:MAG: type II secretion system GspH family protein [Gammaproteobacteria bacterium]|nr:type II secretion system GspH family protein [Gammaproteobacteria bacterium]